MKFNIKFKIIALGVLLSALVTASSLVFSNYEYLRRGRDNQLTDINNWLDNTNTIFNGEGGSGKTDSSYGASLKETRLYFEKQVALFPDDPPSGSSKEEQKIYYKERFSWMYSIDGIAMHFMSEEEFNFRNNYERLVYYMSDSKEAANIASVYIGFLNENNDLCILGDNFSYRPTIYQESRFPGSKIHNFNHKFEPNGKYYDVNYDGYMNKVVPVYYDEEFVAYMFVEYNFNKVDADAAALMNTSILVLSLTSILMIIVFSIGAHFLISRNVSKLNKLTSEFSNDLSNGKVLEVKDPNIKSKDEIEELSHSFVALENDIIKYIDVIQKETTEKERMNIELSIASNIQLSALPNNTYIDSQVTVKAFIKSAKEVGGDFYDYFYLDPTHLVIVISDVSGKGIPAALFMMKSKELIKSKIKDNLNLVEAVKEVNNTLVNNNKENLFVTSFIGIIDFEKGVINYVNAGHEKPYIISKDRVTKLEGNSNFVIGGLEDFSYVEESHPFNKGDYIFLFTDGLNESINDKKEEFSYLRIENILERERGNTLDNIISKMNASLEEFVKEEEQFDDVTMLIIKNNDKELHLSYKEKDYKIITDIMDRFENDFSYLDTKLRASTGIIIDELVNNLISYEKIEELKIDVSFKLLKNSLEIKIISNGDDYDPFINHKEKYLEGYDESIKEGGLGISIVKDLASSYKYIYKDHQATLTIKLDIK